MTGQGHPQPKGAVRRLLRYSIGSLLVFIAGMAVMLGLLAPFLKFETSPVNPTPWHASLMDASISSKNCTSCHSSMPPRSPSR